MKKIEIAYQLTTQFIEINKDYIFDKVYNSVEEDIEKCSIEKTQLINKIFNSFYENLLHLD